MKIGIDLGGTRLHVALVKNNKIIKEIRTTHEKKDKEYLLNQLTENINKLFNKKITGIAVGVAGVVNKGKIIDAPNIPSMNGFDLGKFLRKNYRKRVVIENDVNCFAVRQHMLYKVKNLVCLTLGTGVGGGIIINNHIYRGSGAAGEIGHMVINENGFEKSGRKGTLEAYCSGYVIERRYERLAGKKKSIMEIARLKDSYSKKIIKETGYYLGVGLANIVNVLNPEMIIIGGGISNIKELFPIAKKEMQKRILKGAKVRIIRNKLKGSTAIGAAALLG